MNVVEIIRKKRDGKKLCSEEISFLISSYVKGKIPDYQFSAFLMAVYFQGMDAEETSNLTKEMLYSGKVIDLSSIPGIKVDKHSTGGVGDKTSLILAPICAAAGVPVPMISGRGLGHTGGTLDKLESIPGFKTDLTISQYKSALKKVGAVLIGQTKEIAPADKQIYALRDVTATVESIPLITASIMSKKLAEGIDALVLDVKTGNGAFMKDLDSAINLATSLADTAKSFKKKVIAYITDMNQPLGNYIGNWLEVYESILILKNLIRNDLSELSLLLAGSMIYLGGKAISIDEGVQIANNKIEDGSAFEKFKQIVKTQGGDVKYIDNPERYPKAKYVRHIKSNSEGYLNFIDCYEIGMCSLELGAGRKTKDDKIDPMAGIIINFKIGDKISKNDIIAELRTNNKKILDQVEQRFMKAIKISKEKSEPPSLIKKTIAY